MFEEGAKKVIESRDYLCELDMIGDADLGVNIARGFEAAIQRLSSQNNPDVGAVLATTGDVLAFEVGSTIGGLVGQAMQEAGKGMASKRSMSAKDLASILAIMLSTIKEIGRARVGDKTLLDALEPAADAASRSAESGRNARETLDDAASAAEGGAASTAEMISRVGRSSYLGERSRGRVDPGAAMIALFLRGMSSADTK